MSETVMTTGGTNPFRTKIEFAGADTFTDEMIRLPIVARYAASLFLVALATGVALSTERLVGSQNVTLVFVIPVVLAATVFGWGPSMASVVSGVLAFDFFFTEPRYSFEIASPTDIGAAVLLLLTAAIVSAVAAEARRRADEARQAAYRAEALRVVAHMVIEAHPAAEIIQAAAIALNRIFRAPTVVLAQRTGSLSPLALIGAPVLTEIEERAAIGCLESRLPSRAQIYPFPNSRFDFWPVTGRSGLPLVLGIDFTRAERPGPGEPERSVEVVAGYLALAIGEEDPA
jgi:K+-sensing histidine kinase KdpD